MAVSVIVPTIGRQSLRETLASIETEPGDEILVIGHAHPDARQDPRARYLSCDRGHDWGCLERTMGIHHAQGTHLAFLDDDDVYLPGTRILMAAAITKAPDRPVLFRMVYPNGFTLWETQELRVTNVSTSMLLLPNDPSRLGTWSTRREGDFDFLASSAWRADDIYWAPSVICQAGHDDAG